MNSENKYYETGSNPYYLNLNNTAKEFSNNQDSTNPENGFISLINKFDIIQNENEITQPIITQEYIITEEL